MKDPLTSVSIVRLHRNINRSIENWQRQLDRFTAGIFVYLSIHLMFSLRLKIDALLVCSPLFAAAFCFPGSNLWKLRFSSRTTW